MYLVEDKCSCGKTCKLPNLTPLKLDIPPACPDNISILGYMGEITRVSAPLSYISDDDRNNLQRSLQMGCLTKSDGSITCRSGLYAITNPSVSGFSGGPVYSVNDIGEIVTWGLFLGGPALPEHKLFVNLANKLFQNSEEAIKEIKSIDKQEYPFFRLHLNSIKSDYNNPIGCAFGIKMLYTSIIKTSIIKGFRNVEELNHNLCLPLYRIFNFLNKYGIITPQ